MQYGPNAPRSEGRHFLYLGSLDNVRMVQCLHLPYLRNHSAFDQEVLGQVDNCANCMVCLCNVVGCGFFLSAVRVFVLVGMEP